MNDLPKDATSRLNEMLVLLFDSLGQPSAGDWHHSLKERGFDILWSQELISDIAAERADQVVFPDPNPYNYDHATKQRSVLLVSKDFAFKMLALGALP